VIRDLEALSDKTYDLVIIGGGIYGACVAWDAVLRGLSVALVEKGDFGSATSANSLKVIHGGFRYLQNLDLRRMRISINERKALMRIAPHLIHPLPVLIPTYGHGLMGREVMSIALFINDIVGFDRNQLSDLQKFIPRGRAISKHECLRLAPTIPERGLTGGVVFYDAQVHNSERLIISFLRTAENAGARVANYLEVIGFLRKNGRISGVEVEDQLTGDQFHIRARMVVNTSGPWIYRVLSMLDHREHCPEYRFAKAINLVTPPLFEKYAVGVSGGNVYNGANVDIKKEDRFFFVVPWRGRSLVGTYYAQYDDVPDRLEVEQGEIQTFLDIINQMHFANSLRMEEITFVHAGLLPISGFNPVTGQVKLTKRHLLYDHRSDGVEGLLSVVGVKYTTARYVAEKVVDRIFEIWGQTPPQSQSSQIPIFGGKIEDFETFLEDTLERNSCGLDEGSIYRLVYNYGDELPRIMDYITDNARSSRKESDPLPVLRAEITHAVREEMAQKLTDVVLRRTEVGSAGYPDEEHLWFCAQVMGEECGWRPERIQRELEEVNDVYFHPQ
jgi:glycerol-3-phosphate dehydrogenase